jgi:predicted small lipoprotein YifL
MPRLAALLTVTLLAACGADGPPVPPTKADTAPALKISGEARIGVVKQF